MSVQADQLLDAVEDVVGSVPRPVPLHEPTLGPEELARVARTLEAGWVSTAAPAVADFESAICARTGSPHAVCVSSGTAALHLALRGVGVSDGDEVLVPAITFVATANAVRHSGAFPHLVDVEDRYLGLDLEALDSYFPTAFERRGRRWVARGSGRRLGAVVVVHVLGHIHAPDELIDWCRAREIPLVEDAAEAVGSYHDGRHAGSWGDASVLSFNGNKIVTTGGGGAVLTCDAGLADHVRHLSSTARVPHRWAYRHDEVAYNYRLPGLLAAVGLAQFERLDALVCAKRALADRYHDRLGGIDGLRTLREPPRAASNYWLNAVTLPGSSEVDLNAVIDRAWDRGIQVRPLWAPLHELPMYASMPRARLDVAERVAHEVVCLPSSSWLADR